MSKLNGSSVFFIKYIATNMNLDQIRTPIRVKHLISLLEESKFGPLEELNFLKAGFTNGFSIAYEGPINRQKHIQE